MTMQEISTAVQYNLPIKDIYFEQPIHGNGQTMARVTYMKKNYSESYSEALPDFVKLAEAYGCVGIRAESPDELDAKIEEMINIDKTSYF